MKRSITAVLFLFCSNSLFAANPQLQWERAAPGVLPQSVVVDASNPQYLYAALKSGGVEVLRDTGSKAVSVAKLHKTQLGSLDAMNLTLHKQVLYVALGDFFKKQDHAGLAAVDVRDPRRPKLLSLWKSPTPLKGCAVVVVNDKRAYLGAMTAGVITLDISNSRQVRHLNTFQPDIQFPKPNPNNVSHPNARGLALDGRYLYVAYDAGGLRVLDVSRDQPREVSRYLNAGMKNKQQAYNNVLIHGSRAYIAIDYAGLEIVDISNPQRPRQLGWWNPWKADTLSNLWFNSPGHTNQIVLDARRRRVYLSAGDSELLIVDVQRVTSPKLIAQYGQPKNGQGTWGVAFGEQSLYLTYIRTPIPFRGTWSGIRAVTIPR